MKPFCQNFYKVLLMPNLHQIAIVVLKNICKWQEGEVLDITKLRSLIEKEKPFKVLNREKIPQMVEIHLFGFCSGFKWAFPN